MTRQNRFQIIDVGIDCKQPYTGLKKLVLSFNLLEFVSPDLTKCIPNVEYLDVGSNFLYKMSRDNSSLFEKVFWSLKQLRYINLSENELNTLPMKTFSKNNKLEYIDLSHNRLSTIDFSLSSTTNLRILNLSSNWFSTVDVSSRVILNSWISTSFDWTLDLTNNPLLCTHCKDIDVLEWTIKYSSGFSHTLSCSGPNNFAVNMLNERNLIKFKKMCNIPTMAVILVLTLCTFLSVFGVMFYVIVKEKKNIEQRKKLNDKYSEILENDKYLVYIYCSSEDLHFVTECICIPLQAMYAMTLKTEKQVVAIEKGTENAGYSIMRETYSLADKSHVVLIILTSDFIDTDICPNTFESFVHNNKPVVLATFNDEIATIKDKMPVQIKLFSNKKKITLNRNLCNSKEFDTFLKPVYTAIEGCIKNDFQRKVN